MSFAVNSLDCVVKSLRLCRHGPPVALAREVACLEGQLDIIWNDEENLGYFLRGSEDAALALSKMCFLVPELGAVAACNLQPHSALASVLSAAAACRTASLLLSCTAQALQRGCPLEPATVFRLVSSATVALGPAVQVAQLALECASAASASTTHAEHAAFLDRLCSLIFSTAAVAVAVVGRLQGRNPAPALLATVCRPERASVVCHQLGPVLQWCLQLQVPPYEALRSLSFLLSEHNKLPGAHRSFLQEGPSSSLLAALAASYFISQSRDILRPPLGSGPAAAGAAPPGAAVAAAAAGHTATDQNQQRPQLLQHLWPAILLLESTVPWASLEMLQAALVPATGATLHLVRLARQGMVPGSSVEDTSKLLAVVAMAVVEGQGCDSAAGQQQQPRQQQQQGQSQQPQRQQVPTVCLEAAAVCCSALTATLNARLTEHVVRRAESSACGAPSGVDIGFGDIGRWCNALCAAADLLAALGESMGPPPLSTKQFPPLLAAAEAAVRLLAWVSGQWEGLVQLPGAQQADLAAKLTQAGRQLTRGVEMLTNSVARTLQVMQHGSSGSVSAGGSGSSDSAGSSSTRSSSSHADEKGDPSAAAGMRGSNPVSLSAAELRAARGAVACLTDSAAKLAAVMAGTSSEHPAACMLGSDMWCIQIVLLSIELHSFPNCTGSGNVEGNLQQRQLEGALLCLLASLRTLNAGKSLLLLEEVSRGQSNLGPTIRKMWSLAALLVKLDSLPPLAGLGLQQHLAMMLSRTWFVMQNWLTDEFPIERGLYQYMRDAAAQIASCAVAWLRSAGVVVNTHLLDSITGCAATVAQNQPVAVPCCKALQSVWGLIAVIANSLLRQASRLSPPAAADAKSRVELTVHKLEQLPATKLRKKLCTSSFWLVDVQKGLLPALKALAAATLAAEVPPAAERSLQLRVARALATRVCASPCCLNLDGCSEGRLRSQRCSGCGVTRYCSPACQAQDWQVQHGRVCWKLAAEVLAASQQ